jgi:hypothetical protein
MVYFAELGTNNVVHRVVHVDDEHEFRGEVYLAYDLKLGGRWVQTSPGGNIRKNYASVGCSYDAARDAFIAQRPFPSWILDENSCRWMPPRLMPDNGDVFWNESAQRWVGSNPND